MDTITRILGWFRFTPDLFYIRGKSFIAFSSHVYLMYILTLFKSEVQLFLTKATAVVSYCENCTRSCSNGSSEELYWQQTLLLWSKHGYLHAEGCQYECSISQKVAQMTMLRL